MPQSLLYQEIRLAVDRLCPVTLCEHARCASERASLVRLADANPHNFWSMKVLHNIGRRRLMRVLDHTVPTDEAARARARAALSKSMRGTRELDELDRVVIDILVPKAS